MVTYGAGKVWGQGQVMYGTSAGYVWGQGKVSYGGKSGAHVVARARHGV